PGVSDGTTFSAVYTIKQSDVDAGKVTNQATATGKTPNNTPVTVSSDDPLTPAPGDGTTTTLSAAGKMVLQKRAVFNDVNGNGTAEAGETITYSFTVRNTGSVTLTGITINDPLVPVTGSIASLAPGVSDGTTFSAVYTIKQSDVDAGKVTNQATATGKTPNNTPVTVSSDDPLTPAPGDGTTTTLSAAGKMVLQKNAVFNDVNGNGTAEAGETITYSFTVQNTGSVTLTGITINDPLVPVTGSIASLAPGVSDATTFSAVYTIKQSDVDAGQVTNQATGRGQTPSGTPVISISDDPSTSVPNDPTKTTLPKVDPSQLKISIDLLKTYVLNDENGNGRVDVGETIDYKFTVTNTGQVNLMDVVLTDDFLPGVVVSGGPIKLLVPGQRDVNTFSARYRVTQEDLNKGQILNQASVKARDGIGRIAQDMSDDPGNPTNKDVNGDNNPDDVTAININNCEIKVYDIISANNDGINDELKIEGLNCYLKNRVDIFNRWGIKVFGTENYGKNNNTFSGYSDGRVTIQRGQKLPTGTYYYVIEYIDSTGKTMKKAGPLYVITK
ncbi:gliding motility-associated C-terminal domain-containing protein, partial [Pedobacter gandavensis]|uniref:DUF7507 domain-containing protein n=1 Tax=Pedobacter gandavensis TaxID=2679963 RepID=UPI002930F9C3